MGNAVGPVALIAAGIYLGYLTLAGKTSAFIALLKGTTPATTPAPAAASTSTLSNVTNPWGIMNATPQQQLINSQIPLTLDPLVGTSGG